MKKTAAFCLALLLAHAAFADIYSAAMQQARKVANGSGNNSEETPPSTPPSTPPPAAQPAPAQPDPALQATLHNIASLQTDFAALANASDTNSIATQKQALLNDLTAAAQSSKPAATSVIGLANDLAAATTNKEKLHPQLQKLAQYVHALFNSSHLSDAQQQTLLDGVQKILTDAGVSIDDTISVVTDLKTIATETK